MKRHFLASMTAGATMLLGLAAQAAPMLSLSSGTNLNTLVVGQTAMINVLLTGLTPGRQLQELLASVSFDPTIFMQPGSVTPGPIVPNTAPPFFKTSTSVPGFVDGLYDTGGLGAPNLITGNGVFYSFTLKNPFPPGQPSRIDWSSAQKRN